MNGTERRLAAMVAFAAKTKAPKPARYGCDICRACESNGPDGGPTDAKPWHVACFLHGKGDGMKITIHRNDDGVTVTITHVAGDAELSTSAFDSTFWAAWRAALGAARFHFNREPLCDCGACKASDFFYCLSCTRFLSGCSGIDGLCDGCAVELTEGSRYEL